MRIFGICLIRNEIDIIERTLLDALRWIDCVWVLDHESDDGTWQLLQDRFGRNPKVVLVGRATGPFRDGLRAIAYDAARAYAKKGDWWCRLDSDEFYIDDPREFLAGVPSAYDVVKAASFQYYFTEKDAIEYSLNPSAYREGRSVEALKHYACNSSEARFVRHRDKDWGADNLWPDSAFPSWIWRKHIRLKHFQYRYPEQIQSRLDLRAATISGNQFKHELRSDWGSHIGGNVRIKRQEGEQRPNQTWEERVVQSTNLELDRGDGDYRIRPEMLDRIPGALEQTARRVAKWLLRR
ncbi:glycosyltransferase family 2 protein [Chitinasiproducens palmae]|uniref:Glycosyl transferase family 2 n=1 Tax=Chitinasiproducens palmae TaxID=1770053 RepID=A0A1H2PPE0_9BURK|nr:glycosyltransferase family 2 protein [Chitinasiproducens palmae]SDV48607.1 Glycosyl transferase family 2 [Chitinasiproducens palmae]